MGSGLILLVIVAAWLAVLVPMALRSSDSADSLSSVDRFSDAMRVLSRRDAAARARANAVAGRSRLGEHADDHDDHDVDDVHDVDDDYDDEYDDDLDEWDDHGGTVERVRTVVAERVVAPLTSVAARVRHRRTGPPLTPAARRRRLLLGLLTVAATTLVLGLLVSPLLLVVHGVADLLVAGYVVQLRRLVLQRQAAARRRARPVPAPRRELREPVRVPAEPVRVEEPAQVDEPVAYAATGTDDAVPAEPAEPVQTAARHDEPLAVSPGLGAPWSPVPVPPPVYASAPVVPRYSRTVDLTRPGAYSEAAASGERLPGMDDELPQTERPAEPRRVVNDW